MNKGTQWAVFEPNDGRLWASVRESISNLFRDMRQNNDSEFLVNSPKSLFDMSIEFRVPLPDFQQHLLALCGVKSLRRQLRDRYDLRIPNVIHVVLEGLILRQLRIASTHTVT